MPVAFPEALDRPIKRATLFPCVVTPKLPLLLKELSSTITTLAVAVVEFAINPALPLPLTVVRKIVPVIGALELLIRIPTSVLLLDSLLSIWNLTDPADGPMRKPAALVPLPVSDAITLWT